VCVLAKIPQKDYFYFIYPKKKKRNRNRKVDAYNLDSNCNACCRFVVVWERKGRNHKFVSTTLHSVRWQLTSVPEDSWMARRRSSADANDLGRRVSPATGTE
jgi:hypothetical protein